MRPLFTSRTREVERLARELLAAHGLLNWSFAFNRRKTTMGVCFYTRRTIELSIHFVERNEDAEIRDTLLHEIAHALVGPRHGHDAVWKAACRRIGARPERLAHEVKMPVGRWQAQCSQCGTRYHRYRRPKRMRGWFCRACGPARGGLSWSCLRFAPTGAARDARAT